MTREIKIEIPEGTPAAKCRGCGAAMYWVKTAGGKNMPVDPDGTPHWATCKAAGRFRGAAAGRNGKPAR